jgi:hypothetical protein
MSKIKLATSKTPQVVTLIVDDSTSMREVADGGKSKSTVATESIQDMVMTTQSGSLGATEYRFLMNIAKFGDAVTVIAEAKPPEEINLNKVAFKGSLKKCRSTVKDYNESETPPPLVIFLSDGGNKGPKLDEVAARSRNIEFEEDRVNVIARWHRHEARALCCDERDSLQPGDGL